MAKGKKIGFGKKLLIAVFAGLGAYIGTIIIPLSPITTVAGAAVGAFAGYYIATGEKF